MIKVDGREVIPGDYLHPKQFEKLNSEQKEKFWKKEATSETITMFVYDPKGEIEDYYKKKELND